MFKTIKRKIIFVFIFSVMCLMFTAILVLYNNIDIVDKAEEISQTTDINHEKDVEGIDLKGTYNQNDLKIEEKSITQEKIEIRYLQINGLKDKKIENNINKEIEQIALNCYKNDIKDLNEVINVSVSMWEAANFANTISFELSYVAKIDDNDNGFYQGIQGINYDLNTGNKITLDKIFTSDVQIEDVFRRGAYYSLVKNRAEDNLAGDLIISNYKNIEDEIAEIIYLYKKGKITQFYYTPRIINFVYKDKQVISIDMDKISNYIAIYNRYLTDKSIFENNDIGIKNIYTLTRRYNNVYYYTNYQKESNYFIDISVDYQSTENDEFAKDIINKKIVEIEKQVEEVKQKVKNNSNKFYIMNYYISIYTGEDISTDQILTSYSERGNTYEMTVHDFEENIEPIIINYCRKDSNGGLPDYVYDFTEVLRIDPQHIIEYYNPETKEKIVI